jgi:hypothetical protein
VIIKHLRPIVSIQPAFDDQHPLARQEQITRDDRQSRPIAPKLENGFS